MGPAPEVTVVIPTKDRWDLLSTSALPSALAQEDVELEVVVVDDGSSDATGEGLQGVADERVRLVRHERPRGVAQARNAGIREARGRWIAFLDDDDLWSPRKLRLQLDAAERSDAVFAYGGAAAIAEDRAWLYSLAPTAADGLIRALLARNVLWGGSSNVVARSDVLRDLRGFDEALFQLCDWDLWIRLGLSGRAAACDEIVVGCVVHPRSMLLVSEDDVFQEFEYLEEKHRAASEAYGVSFDRSVFNRWVALGHLRAGRRARSALLYLRGAVAYRDPVDLARAGFALLGERPAGGRRLLGRTPRRGRADSRQEPEWVARYRLSAAR